MTSFVVYKGELRTIGTHVRSANQIITDAPIDNHGKGEAFSPTDLLATSLASCIFSIMGIMGNKHKVDISGAHATVIKVMESSPRRVAKVIIDITMPSKKYTDKQKKLLEKAASACPVGRSLHPDLIQDIRITWP